jgi:tetratricopeptide (TPR) repeat protein
MPIDSYSLCPGGTGKKIKFCCPELLGDLEKIDRMLQGEQGQACLQHIESLEAGHPDRPCLMAIKNQVLRHLNRYEETVALSERFVELNPENPVALADAAIAAAMQGDVIWAMRLLQRALQHSQKELYGNLLDAMNELASGLLEKSKFRAARALLQLQAAIVRDDPAPMEALSQLNRSSAIPLLLKDDPPLAEAPAEAPWKAAFDDAMASVRRGYWLEGCEKLLPVAEQHPEAPEIWRNLGILRGWLADTLGSIEALEKYAALDVPIEDASEARALAMFLFDDPLGDLVGLLRMVFQPDDEEALLVALSSVTWAIQAAPSQVSQAEGDVPPKAAFFIIDREMPDSAEGIELASVPRIICQAVLFGRQTDRPARLELLGLTESDREAVLQQLAGLQATGLEQPTEEERFGELSASHRLLQRPWRVPRDTNREQLLGLIEEHQRTALLQQWPELPLGLLDGRTPRQAADDQSNHADLLAAVLLLEFWNRQAGNEFDFNELRSELGLPTLGPIDPQQTPVEQLPLVRLKRVEVEKASDEALQNGFRRAVVFGATGALKKFAQQVAERPKFAGTEDRFRALSLLSRVEPDAEKAVGYLHRGRDEAEAAGQSSAPWDLMELSVQIEHGNPDEATRLISHLQSQHMNEPGVAESLTQILVQVGAIRPDGSPVEPGPAPTAGPEAGAGPQAAPGELWTPESQKPEGDKPKIWTPGMD